MANMPLPFCLNLSLLRSFVRSQPCTEKRTRGRVGAAHPLHRRLCLQFSAAASSRVASTWPGVAAARQARAHAHAARTGAGLEANTWPGAAAARWAWAHAWAARTDSTFAVSMLSGIANGLVVWRDRGWEAGSAWQRGAESMDAHPGGEDGRGLPGEYVARRVARGTTSACARPGGKDGSGLRGKYVAGRRDGTTSTGARPGGASVATRM